MSAGVEVDVLLPGQPHQLVHHLVDHGALDEPVARQPLEPAEIHRLAELDLDPAEPPPLAAGRIDGIGSDHRDRNHRNAGLQRQPRQPRLALVEPPVGRAGALRIHAEQLALTEDACGGGQRGLRAVGVGAVDRHLARGGVEPPLKPALDPRSGEVLGLGQEGDPPADHQRLVEAVRDREVVTGQDRRAGVRNIFQPFDFGAAEQRQQGSHEDVLEQPIPHGPSR